MKKIRYRIKELIKQREKVIGRRLTIKEVAEKSGVSRQTLTRMVSPDADYSAKIEVLIRLRYFFDCGIDDLFIQIEE